MKRAFAVLAIALLTACSFQNKNEREAEKITRAAMNNDFGPVQNDLAKGTHITRVQIAEWSDELSAQGPLRSVKETTENCQPGVHCFTVKFDKHNYVETMRLDEEGKVVDWRFHMVQGS
ncbi:MAG TPA: hypothetical protein VFE36_03280 [Candidatus Baltobacteraceae bacterium]|nr:hypothetical protein [Candidatus Baltobacteraceae bacterium]